MWESYLIPVQDNTLVEGIHLYESNAGGAQGMVSLQQQQVQRHANNYYGFGLAGPAVQGNPYQPVAMAWGNYLHLVEEARREPYYGHDSTPSRQELLDRHSENTEY